MIARLLSRLPGPLSSLAVRFQMQRIDSTEALAEFVGTRSAYVTQTALYGYLKTRMGTQFTRYFEDGVFSEAIRGAAEKQFQSGLCDLAVFAAATANTGRNLSDDQVSALAMHCFIEGHQRALPEGGSTVIPEDVLGGFQTRLAHADWIWEAEGRHAFARSEADLIRNAPVIDQYKKEDEEIVTNSIRFRWRDIREQLRTRIERDALCEDWRSLGNKTG